MFEGRSRLAARHCEPAGDFGLAFRKDANREPARALIMPASRLLLSRQTRTRSGSSESDVKLETVMPYTSPSSRVVTTVTPLAHEARAPRSRRGVGSGARGL